MTKYASPAGIGRQAKRRGRERMELDVLRLLESEGSVGFTRIMYGVNLNYLDVKGFLTDLIGKGLVEPEPRRARNTYKLTPLGYQVLGNLAQVDKVMRTNDYDPYAKNEGYEWQASW